MPITRRQPYRFPTDESDEFVQETDEPDPRDALDEFLGGRSLAAPQVSGPAMRNQAKVDLLRKLLGLDPEAEGTVGSQADLEAAYEDVYQPFQEERAQQRAYPQRVAGQYGLRQTGLRNRGALDVAEQHGRSARDVAEIEAAGRIGAAERRAYRTGPGPLVQVLDPKTGQAMWVTREDALGKPAGGTGEERGKLRGLQDLSRLLDQVETAGNTAKWEGIGPLGPVEKWWNKMTGMGNQQAEAFRNMLDRLVGEISFGEGGKQLTSTEKEVILGYLADISTSPTTAQTRLRSVRSMIQPKLGRYGITSADIADEGDESDWVTER